MLTHKPTVSLLRETIDKLQKQRGRALDAGCGDGRLVKYLFALKFSRVDMFDPSEKAIAECHKLKDVNPVIYRVEKRSF